MFVAVKRTGSLIILLLLTFPLFAADAQLDKQIIGAGESTLFRIRIEGKSSDIAPEYIPTVDGLVIRHVGTQTTYENINGRRWRGVILSFRITAQKKGKYKIPAFRFRTTGGIVSTKPQTLLVKEMAAEKKRAGVHSSVSGMVEVSAASAFPGEPVLARYFLQLDWSGDIEFEGFESQPMARGALVERVDELIDDEITEDGTIRKHVATFVLVPQGSGTVTLQEASGVISIPVSDGFFVRHHRRRLHFDTASFEVSPAPAQSECGGAVTGSFTITIAEPKEQVEVYGEALFEITLEGKGNILTLPDPHFVNEPENAEVLITRESRKLRIEDNMLAGTVRYRLSYIPENAGLHEPGALVLDTYDLEKGTCRRIETAPLEIEARQGENSSQAVEEAGVTDKDERGIVSYIWIILAALLAVALAVFLTLFFAQTGRVKKKDEMERVKEDAEEDIDEELPSAKKGIVEMRLLMKKGDCRGALKKSLTLEGQSLDDSLREEIEGLLYGGKPLTDEECRRILGEVERRNS